MTLDYREIKRSLPAFSIARVQTKAENSRARVERGRGAARDGLAVCSRWWQELAGASGFSAPEERPEARGHPFPGRGGR